MIDMHNLLNTITKTKLKFEYLTSLKYYLNNKFLHSSQVVYCLDFT